VELFVPALVPVLHFTSCAYEVYTRKAAAVSNRVIPTLTLEDTSGGDE
jgi:hypothetical protein